MVTESPQRAPRRMEPCEDSECAFCRKSPDIGGQVCCFGLRDVGCYRENGYWGDTVRWLVRKTTDSEAR